MNTTALFSALRRPHAARKTLTLVVALLGMASSGCAANLGAPTRLAARGERAQVQVSGSGTVQSDDGDIECGGSASDTQAACNAELVDWDKVTLTATPAPGWRFAGWRTSDRAPRATSSTAGTTFVYEAVFVRAEGIAQAAR